MRASASRCVAAVLVASILLVGGSEAGAVTLQPLDQVDGQIVDFSADRLLVLQGATLRIHDRATHVDQAIPAVSGRSGRYGFLIDGGAILEYGQSSTNAGVYQWNGSTLTAAGDLSPAETLSVAQRSGHKRFALWNDLPGTDARFPRLILRDLKRRTNVVVAQSTIDQRVGNSQNAVVNDGTVLFWDGASSGIGADIFRYRDGTTENLTNDANGKLLNTGPVTDGTRVVFQSTLQVNPRDQRIVLYDDQAGTRILSDLGEPLLLPGTGYAVSNGWVAFFKRTPEDPHLPASGFYDVWLRSPRGKFSKLSADVLADLAPMALSTNGKVVYVGSDGHAYLGRRGKPPLDLGTSPVSPSLPTVPGNGYRWVDGKLFVVDGGVLSQVAF